MKRHVLAVFSALLVTVVPSMASQGGPKPKSVKPQASVSKPPKVTTSVKPVSVKPTASKPKATTSVKTTTVKPVKSTAKAIKPVKTTATKPVKSETKATKPAKTTKSAKADSRKATSSIASIETTPTTLPDSPSGTTLTPVQQKLKRNTNLASKLEGRLPQGTDLMKAAEGFKNLGQFVAAVNVSNNHDFSFTELKTLMVDDGYSLGQAIQQLKASANGTVEAQRAEADAQRLIATTESQTSSTTVTTTASKKPKKAIGGQQ